MGYRLRETHCALGGCAGLGFAFALGFFNRVCRAVRLLRRTPSSTVCFSGTSLASSATRAALLDCSSHLECPDFASAAERRRLRLEGGR